MAKDEFKNLFEERNHIENLLNTRFNFLIVVFASIIAGLISAKSLFAFILILGSGFFIVALLTPGAGFRFLWGVIVKLFNS